jgi:hypothetical protein
VLQRFGNNVMLPYLMVLFHLNPSFNIELLLESLQNSLLVQNDS